MFREFASMFLELASRDIRDLRWAKDDMCSVIVELLRLAVNPQPTGADKFNRYCCKPKAQSQLIFDNGQNAFAKSLWAANFLKNEARHFLVTLVKGPRLDCFNSSLIAFEPVWPDSPS